MQHSAAANLAQQHFKLTAGGSSNYLLCQSTTSCSNSLYMCTPVIPGRPFFWCR